MYIVVHLLVPLYALKPQDKWSGASLVLVVVENCLDRHAEEDGERVALIWEVIS